MYNNANKTGIAKTIPVLNLRDKKNSFISANVSYYLPFNPSEKPFIKLVELPLAIPTITITIATTRPTAPVMIPARAIPEPGFFFTLAITPVMIAAIGTGAPQRPQQQPARIETIPSTRDTIARVLLPSCSGAALKPLFV